MNEKILIVDDDVLLAKGIEKRLEREGYTTLLAHDGLAALEILRLEDISLLLLDIMMPKLDGLSTLIKIREEKNIPIIMLSAKTQDTDKILGLSMGADDYISKPYHPDELVARVKAQLRRYYHLGDFSNESNDIIHVGELAIDHTKKEFSISGQPVRLTPTEYKILDLLMSHPGKVFSADAIYSSVWQEESYAVENTIMVHIRRIREKIEINPKEPQYLKVVWGVGYKIDERE